MDRSPWAGPHNEGDLDVGAQLDEAELADLREAPSPRAPPRGGRRRRRWPESRGRRGPCRRGHQPEPTVEGPRRLGPGQRADDPLEEVPDRGDPQPPPGHAEAGAMRRLLADAESSGVLEDLPDRQVGQDPHREHDPEDDLVGQHAAHVLIRPVGVNEGWRTTSGRITCSRPASRSKIRPDSSAGSVHCPRGMRVAASWLPRFSANPR